MSQPTFSDDDRFKKLIDDLAKSCHGSNELKALKMFLSNDLKKTLDRETFLLPKLVQEAMGLATSYASMTVAGWHLLNGLIQENETRAADIAEATTIRTQTKKK